MTEGQYAHLAPSYVAETIWTHFPTLGIVDAGNLARLPARGRRGRAINQGLGDPPMIISDVQDLFRQEHAIRFGKTGDKRAQAILRVIEIALHHSDARLREHAWRHMLSMGIAVVAPKPATSGPRPLREWVRCSRPTTACSDIFRSDPKKLASGPPKAIR
jgi:hypothetical protein